MTAAEQFAQRILPGKRDSLIFEALLSSTGKNNPLAQSPTIARDLLQRAEASRVGRSNIAAGFDLDANEIPVALQNEIHLGPGIRAIRR